MSKSVRFVFAVVTALVAWGVVATLINFILRAAIPGYRAEEAAVSFSLGSQVARLALALVSTAAAAVLAYVVSRGMLAASVTVGIVLLALFLPAHVTLWGKFPVWYHVFFLASLPVGSYLFAKLWASHRVTARRET
jgi:hypothetical protein